MNADVTLQPPFSLPEWAELCAFDGASRVKARDHELYVDCYCRPMTSEHWRAAVNNLGGAIFEKENPGVYSGLHIEEATEMVGGKPMHPQRRALLVRLRELSVPSE